MNESTKKVVKNALLWLGAFTAYRLYKLYEVSESVIYKPVGVTFKRGATINDFIVRVKVEIMNPQKTVVYLRGIDGRLMLKDNQTIGYFTTGKATITPGISYISMDFSVDAKNIGAPLIQAIIKKQVPVLYVEMNTRLPFFTTTEVFAVNPGTVPTDSVFVG
jgi:hypothetical protein